MSLFVFFIYIISKLDYYVLLRVCIPREIIVLLLIQDTRISSHSEASPCSATAAAPAAAAAAAHPAAEIPLASAGGTATGDDYAAAAISAAARTKGPLLKCMHVDWGPSGCFYEASESPDMQLG